MAMVGAGADAFVGCVLSKLKALLVEEASMTPGVRDDLMTLMRKLDRLEFFLLDAERKAIEDLFIRSWLGEIKDLVYDVDDVIDLCRIEGTKLLEGDQPSTSTQSVRSRFSLMSCFSATTCFSATKFRYEIAEQIKSLNTKLQEIEESKPTRWEITTEHGHSINRDQTSPVMANWDYVGPVTIEATQHLVSYIIEESEHKTKCRVLGIVGMGGIEKTTLASQVYNHPSIVSHFPYRIWVCVSNNFSVRDILKKIIRQTGGVCGEASSYVELCYQLSTSLSRKFLIVLDDVWRTDVWEDTLRSPLEKCGAPSGMVVVTTRDLAIARNMRAYIHNVEKMSNRDGWALLCKRVFRDDGEEEEVLGLKDIGVQIVEKCDGLPLAIKAIAGVLTTKATSREEWQKLLRNHAWSMDQHPIEPRGALYLSYADLPSYLKQCFLYCSLFREGSIIYREDLIRYWVAEGFIREDEDGALMEDKAEDYYNQLIMRNLLQPDSLDSYWKSCRMHDLIRRLAQFLIGEENMVSDAEQLRLLNGHSLRNVRRLSIISTSETITSISDGIRENGRGLRSLHWHGIYRTTLPSDMRKLLEGDDLVKILRRLRVLDLSKSEIQRLPSVGKLVHLRYLNLNDTKINMLPESIGNLVNLQTLCLSRCVYLQYLPKGITQLSNLRCLDVDSTTLVYLPTGFNQLKQLNRLKGFFVGDVDNLSKACKIEELQPLSLLRVLSIDKLERVSTETLILTNKQFLRELNMSFSLASEIGSQYSEMEIKRIENVMEEVFPPPRLQLLIIDGYPGCRYPRWMSKNTCFSRLESLELVNCMSCTQFPPLGKLPQLNRLLIKGADSIVTVGPELLFTRQTQTEEGAFPRLEYLQFMNMDNWEKWALDDDEWALDDDESINNGKLLPCLKRLEISYCPKLRSLPAGLRYATKLEKLYISNARCIQEIKNLPFLSKLLKVVRCPCLKKIHDLPLVQMLIIGECQQLTHVADLNSLHNLALSLYPTAERLPDWLSMLRPLRPDFQIDLCLQWNLILLQRSRKGGEDWPIIKRFPQVNIHCRGKSLYYTNAEA